MQFHDKYPLFDSQSERDFTFLAMRFHAKYPLFDSQSDREFTFSYAILIIIIIIIIIVIVIIIIIITLLLLFIYCNREVENIYLTEVLGNHQSFSLIIIPILLFCFIGGRGKVANLYDNLHPGTVSGKLDGLWLVK